MGYGKKPFKMKSGNSPLFKKMGASPVKQEKKDIFKSIGNIVKSFGDFLGSKKKKSSTNIGENLRKKYGTGEYKIGGSKASEAGKRPGESKRKFKKRTTKKVVIDNDSGNDNKGDAFKPITFSGKKGDKYSYRTTKSGGYQYKLGNDPWTTAKSKKGLAAIDALFKSKN
tara:strand:- start:356 stop:862 length:507 start_codon:yes stop_codon:yes gene_type:complete